MSDIPWQLPDKQDNAPAHDLMAELLVMDIQHSSEWAKDLATKIEEVKSGKLAEWERIGNAFYLKISTDGAIIEDMVDESRNTQLIPLQQFQEAVNKWLETIASNP